MLKITTPATTSNLAVGFDAIGMAVDLYNVFTFEEAGKFSFSGFSVDPKDNLVYQAYISFCQSCGVNQPKPLKIALIANQVPISRGLGSSASLIVAGVLAANHFNQLKQSQLECAAFASEMEGHPDNVFACMFGGLTAVVKTEEGYYYDSFLVSSDLQFTVLIPEAVGSTEELRKVLPKQVSMQDAVYHLSRTIHLPNAFATGDLNRLQVLLRDKLHEQYRAPYLIGYDAVKTFAKKQNAVSFVSGSGPTQFLIHKGSLEWTDELRSLFEATEVSVSSGVMLEVSG
ncbi:MAG: homoserine kinase [Bacilli bacterium]|nr:homoserine kinase [Bacilli bacterium]MBN2876666.1 homoserine kinase [Bacilli bacterium]